MTGELREVNNGVSNLIHDVDGVHLARSWLQNNGDEIVKLFL